MLDKIKEVVAGFMGILVSEVVDDRNFLEMGMDSLTLLKIIISLENSFGVHFEDHEIVEIRTVIDIFELISKKVSE